MGKSGPSSHATPALAERLKGYGCAAIVAFDEKAAAEKKFTPEQLDYLDLLLRPKETKLPGGRLAAAVQNQGSTLLYIVDSQDGDELDISARANLQRLLANRSEPAWLGVCTPGELQIYPIGFHVGTDLAPIATIRAEQPEASLFFQSLAQGTFNGGKGAPGNDYVFDEIRQLLQQTTDAYVPNRKLKALDVLSMAGRALFFRFLLDRGIVRDDDLEDICPSLARRNALDLRDVFINAEAAAQTSAWLDATFNGDFLPLTDDAIPSDDRPARTTEYRRFYRNVAEKTDSRFFDDLTAILKGWHRTGNSLQTTLNWDVFNFAHIPVGVLSQVYEHFSHLVDSEDARAKSVHYTPRLIAELMVGQTFAAMPEAKRPEARVLDPSCGAGIFLVLAFRRLVRERWRQDGTRPDTQTLQKILYGQVRGFDLSESALRLAALSLYITAIELNATQRPPKALKFPKNLRDRVLFNVSEPDDSSDATLELGSLGPRAPREEEGTFDLVIGNPPWTRHREEKPVSKTRRIGKSSSDLLNEAYTAIAQRVLTARDLGELAASYENPDKNPDLPFIWRSMEWAKAEGLIAFALPTRIFTHTHGKGQQAWNAVMSSLGITGLINGSDLRWSVVWEDVKFPFGLLFARNVLPKPDHRFFFTAPVNDPAPNSLGRFRIDYQATQPISVERIKRQPWILKTLTLGTWQDVEAVESILAAFPQTLEQAWLAWNSTGDKTGQGYNLSPGLSQKPAPFLGALLDFSPSDQGFLIGYDSLSTFRKNHGRTEAHMPRTEALYKSPLIIVPKAPGEDPESPKAYLATRPTTFSQSYYGYSCADHPDADTLASLLYLIPHSTLFRYFSLMISVSQGADRMMFTKGDLDALPFPDVTTLATRTKTALCKLAHRLQHDDTKPWDEIDDCLFDLYRIDTDTREVIRDTLFSAAAYRRAGREALGRTTRDTRAPFRDALHAQLSPFFAVTNQQIEVTEHANQPGKWEQPWHFITIGIAGDPLTVSPSLLRAAMQEADKTGSSRIIVRAPRNRGILIGLLNQRRWWTPTRARQCGRDLIRRHLDAFGVSAVA